MKFKINYNEETKTKPPTYHGRDDIPPGLYKNLADNGRYDGVLYVNRDKQKFYVDPSAGITDFDLRVWGNEEFEFIKNVESIMINLG